MSLAVIRFEVTVPCPDSSVIGTSNATAIFNFINGLVALTACWYYQVSVAPSGDQQCWYNIYGYLTALQATPALALLTTLNSALSAPWTPVKCVQWTATSEP